MLRIHTIDYEKLMKTRRLNGKNRWKNMSVEERTKHIKKMSDAAKKAINKAKKEWLKKKKEGVDN